MREPSRDERALVAGWSCDERKRTACRNGHGCHCREITSLSQEVERLTAELAKEAGVSESHKNQRRMWQRAAEEVRAETIEACAQIFEDGGHELWTPDEAASAIRSKSGASDV